MNFDEINLVIAKHSITDFSILNIDEIPEFELNLKELPEELFYLKKNERKHPKLFYPKAKSILIFIFQYWDSSIKYDEIIKNIFDPYLYILNKYPKAQNILQIKKTNLKIARYALVYEYHKKIRSEIEEILTELKEIDKTIEGKIFVDTSPVWEKILAKIAGLGFIGKNTLLISPKFGSYLFLGGLILNKRVENKMKRENIKNGCGSCNRCIELCPTKALSENGLNFTRCISFWTTHTKREIPTEIIEKTEYLFGCDICQEVCPYNKKAIRGRTIFNIKNQ